MKLQCFSDCTLIDESGTRLIGPGEQVTLPLHDALQVMNLAHEHFKILEPTPLLPGVAVCWVLGAERVQGPGIVQQLEGRSPNRLILILGNEGTSWIHEQSVSDVDPWPAIDAKLEEATDHALRDGEHSPKVTEVREWLFAHFQDREPWMR